MAGWSRVPGPGGLAGQQKPKQRFRQRPPKVWIPQGEGHEGNAGDEKQKSGSGHPEARPEDVWLADQA
ncbi:MAG TPA: hypothetical protein VEQ37_10600 [Actinomycetota bacterium]|nr:hypothetical protein [Actinomycetota bacterium]